MKRGYNQNNMNNMNMPYMPRDNDEYMYPEVYHKFSPIADRIIKEMERQYGEINLDEDMLNEMIEEAIRRSGMNMNNMPMPPAVPYDGKDGEAVPTITEYDRRYGRYDRDRDHWRRYDHGAISDIFRILFLQQLFGRRRHNWRWR